MDFLAGKACKLGALEAEAGCWLYLKDHEKKEEEKKKRRKEEKKKRRKEEKKKRRRKDKE
jgi:hypothetical protein